MSMILLSPSQQPWNLYADGSGSEQDHMQPLAHMVADLLRTAGHEVTVLETGDYTTNVAAANNITRGGGAAHDYYLAIHSNATGGGGEAHGVEGHHNGDADPVGRRLVEAVVAEIDAVDEWPSRGCRYSPELWEVRGTDAPGGLVEVAFHDNAHDAAWITANLPKLARAIARGIVTVAGGSVPPDTIERNTMQDLTPQAVDDVAVRVITIPLSTRLDDHDIPPVELWVRAADGATKAAARLDELAGRLDEVSRKLDEMTRKLDEVAARGADHPAGE